MTPHVLLCVRIGGRLGNLLIDTLPLARRTLLEYLNVLILLAHKGYWACDYSKGLITPCHFVLCDDLARLASIRMSLNPIEHRFFALPLLWGTWFGSAD